MCETIFSVGVYAESDKPLRLKTRSETNNKPTVFTNIHKPPSIAAAPLPSFCYYFDVLFSIKVLGASEPNHLIKDLY